MPEMESPELRAEQRGRGKMNVSETSAPASGSRDMERATQEPRKSEAARSSRDPCPDIHKALPLLRDRFSSIPNQAHRTTGTDRVNTEVAGGSPAQ